MKLLLSLLALFSSSAIATDTLPELEVGVGALAVSLPDYRGARRSSTKVFPIPLLRYRGEFTFSKRIGTFWLGGFVRYDDLHNSKIDDSPLVSKTDSWMGGVGLARVFYEKY